MRLQADGLRLHVYAPTGILTEAERKALAEARPQLLKLVHWERRKKEEADRRGLVIKWAGEPGYLALHDPITGEWHEVPASGCPQWMLDDAKAHRRRKGAV